jgi:hypothetical protein
MSDRISQKVFKEKYGGSLDKLAQRVALEPKKQPNEQETTEKQPRKKYQYLEFKLQVSIAKYLNLKYPKIMFESSPINLNLTEGQRKMMAAIQKDHFHPPDMKLYESRRGYIGFALELKKETPYLKDGVTLKADKHLQNQQESIEIMRGKGWLAGFYWDFDTIKTAIDWYLADEK